MRELMGKANKEGLTEKEKQELQRLFLAVAVQDLRILEDMEDRPREEIQ